MLGWQPLMLPLCPLDSPSKWWRCNTYAFYAFPYYYGRRGVDETSGKNLFPVASSHHLLPVDLYGHLDLDPLGIGCLSDLSRELVEVCGPRIPRQPALLDLCHPPPGAHGPIIIAPLCQLSVHLTRSCSLLQTIAEHPEMWLVIDPLLCCDRNGAGDKLFGIQLVVPNELAILVLRSPSGSRTTHSRSQFDAHVTDVVVWFLRANRLDVEIGCHPQVNLLSVELPRE